MTKSITVDGSTYVIRFDWSAEIVADVRNLPGRRAEPELGHWTVPTMFGAAVEEFAVKHGFDFDENVSRETSPNTVDLMNNGRYFAVRFTYDRHLQAKVSMIERATWFSPASCWMVPVAEGVKVAEWAEEANATISDTAQVIIEHCRNVARNIEMSSAKVGQYEMRDGFMLDLYDYQTAGLKYVMEVADGKCIIGDEPGVGKTAQAMACLHERNAFPAVIVVPASVKINWRREINRAMPHLSVEVAQGNRPKARLFMADVTVINYDILPAWVDLFKNVRGVVLDESHKIKNPAIDRTKAAIELCSRVPEDGVRLCLSGTPVLNKTNEIMTQLQAIGQISKFGGYHSACKQFKKRPKELNRKMRATCYVRRHKVDVWEDAPERQWAELMVEGDPAVMKEYWQAEADIVKYLAERAEQAMLASGATDKEAQTAAWKAALKAEAGKHLVAIGHLKQLSAKAKKPMLVRWAKDFLETGEKLGVFGWFTDSVDSMASALNAVKVQGGQTQEQRQHAVDKFQNDPKQKVICGQILAAGEGITLTAASNALLVDQAWTPGAMDQVLDRFHRRGQVNDVVGYVAIIEGTIDERIQQLIAAKRVEVTQVLDGYKPDEDQIKSSVLQDLVVSLAEKGMKKS